MERDGSAVHGCEECLGEVDHCHGTLVRHRGGGLECSEPGCAAEDPARHLWVLACDLVDGACRCSVSLRPARMVA